MQFPPTPFTSGDSYASLGQGNTMPGSVNWSVGPPASAVNCSQLPGMDSMWSNWNTSKAPNDAGLPPANSLALGRAGEGLVRPGVPSGFPSADSYGSLLGRAEPARNTGGDNLLRQYSTGVLAAGRTPTSTPGMDAGLKPGATLEPALSWGVPKPPPTQNFNTQGFDNVAPGASAGLMHFQAPGTGVSRPYDLMAPAAPPAKPRPVLPTGYGLGVPGQFNIAYNGNRPGSAHSNHSTSSYGLPNGAVNGLGPVTSMTGPAPAAPPHHMSSELELAQQLQSMNVNARVPPPPSPYPPQHVGLRGTPDNNIAALLQARQGGMPSGLNVNNMQNVHASHIMAARQQQQQAPTMSAHAGRGMADVMRGMNGGVGAQVGQFNPAQIAALQQQASARAAQAVQRQQAAFNANINLQGMGANKDFNQQFATQQAQAAYIAEASRVATARQQHAAAFNGLNGNLAPFQAAGLLNKPRVPTRPPMARPAMAPPMRGNGFVPAGVESLTMAHDQTARSVLTELGQTLAQLSITVESAVNAGLLGGLSAADVKVLAEAHAGETQRLGLVAQLERLQASKQQAAVAQQAAQLQQGLNAPRAAAQLGGNSNNYHMLQSQAGNGATQRPQSAPMQPTALQSAPPPPQALFPEAFQLGSSLTDLPKPAPAANGNVPPTSLPLAGGFSFFGGDSVLPTDGSLNAPGRDSQSFGAVGSPKDAAAVQPSAVANVDGGDGLPFDASAYAFFGSVDASDADALPVDGEDCAATDSAFALAAVREHADSVAVAAPDNNGASVTLA